MDISAYLEAIRDIYSREQATEHSYRPALETLFKSIDTSSTGDTGSTALEVINEPRRLTEVGAPDFVFLRGETAIGWCEAKDIGKDIRRFAATDYSKEQKARYVKGLPNLIYTNMLDFEFIRDGKSIAFISIAEAKLGLPARRKAFAELEKWLCDFAAQSPVHIGTAEHLAERMAGKTALIKDMMSKALVADKAANLSTALIGQYEAFQDNLIRDISVTDFADIYAETIAYGLFAARLHDETPGKFSRIRVPDLLPKSNPFLRSLFGYIAGYDLDERIRRVIDELCDIFRVADLHEIFKDFGRSTNRVDPFLHFYETFLAAYNPAKRKARGVWYTPEAVVHFIVRAVDEVLKTDFDLAEGLADTSQVTIDWDDRQADAKGNAITGKRDVHRVQILDPATGTGTFLAEVIRLVAERVQHTAPGAWSDYVKTHLIPRLHGFELLMASYAMCHMRLDMMLTAKDYKPTGEAQRLSVYLTNSLEEGELGKQYALPFAQWLADEAKGANIIKRQTPIMCVIGNPPYAGHSSNKGPWIEKLMKDYKNEPDSKEKLKERNPKWINDDYVKFLRFAEHMIARNGEGVLGFITNHGYLDNPTFRGMRWHLLKTFDKIYVLDLHGNANKREVCPDGSPDKNVFDIKQGVAIIIAVKKKALTGGKALAKVWHGELWGSREGKYKALWAGDRLTCSPTYLPNHAPHYPFVPRDYESEDIYQQGFSLTVLMPVHSVGIVTARDTLTIDMNKQALWDRVQDFTELEAETLRSKYDLGKDVRDWKVCRAKADVTDHFDKSRLIRIAYRPFDTRWTYYTGNARGFQCYPRREVMQHMLSDNVAFQTLRQKKSPGLYQDIFAHRSTVESSFISNKSAEIGYSFPLYLYNGLDVRVNFDSVIYAEICAKAGLCPISPDTPRDEKDFPGDFRAATGEARRDEVKVFDYIYGVLYSPDYRETYNAFLKIDFPRIPYPVSPEVFARISEKGEALRRLHLMEEAAIGATAFRFEGHGDSVVERPRFSAASAAAHAAAHSSTGETPKGRVYINQRQYFSGVSSLVWNFPIGGYYPAQKWLKDRKGRALSFDDIRHYQKICKILAETRQIMKQISSPLA